MATAAQVLANQVNAQHSTGPKSEAGKAASSQNARKHGFSSKTLVILPGQEDAFTELESTLRAQFAPQPGYQEFLFHRILHAAWNQHRCDLAEADLRAESPNDANPDRDPLLTEEPDRERKLRVLATYASRAERSFFKYLKELRDVQTEARYRRDAGIRTSEPSVLTEVQKVDRAMDRSATARDRARITAAMEYAAKAKAKMASAEASSAPAPSPLEQAKPIPPAGFRLRDLLPHRK